MRRSFSDLYIAAPQIGFPRLAALRPNAPRDEK
jgi:hypothetical protein